MNNYKIIEQGNLNQKSKEIPSDKQWIMGFFIDKKSLLHSDDVEIKWSEHPKDEKYKDIKANTVARSLCILLRGKIKITFPDNNEEVVLKKEGDYVAWERGVFHTTEFLEDTKVITIRWPSISDEVIK